MTSSSATVLAVALALGICLLVIVLIAVALTLRLVRDRRSHSGACFKFENQIQERQKKLDTLAQLLNTDNAEDAGTSVYDLPPSYVRTYHHNFESPLKKYTQKWFSNVQRQPSSTDDIARLEEALYLYPSMNTPLSIDRDLRLFSNPQQYTTAEISELLHSPICRHMVWYIMTATLLRNTSINGHPFRTLLPLGATDIDGLYNLAAAMRNGLQLGDRLSVHMYRFGLYRPLPSIRDSVKEPYHEFFETIFKPYFISNSPQAVAERRTDLNEVFDASIAHGMECLAFWGEIDYQWGEKKDGVFELAPAMTCSDGKGGRFKEIAVSDFF